MNGMGLAVRYPTYAPLQLLLLSDLLLLQPRSAVTSAVTSAAAEAGGKVPGCRQDAKKKKKRERERDRAGGFECEGMAQGAGTLHT